MTPLEDIYKKSFFGHRYKLNWRAPIICGAVRKVFNPKKTIDVGCAIGDLVKQFMDWDIDAYGLEGSTGARPFLEVPEDRVFFMDLRQLLHLTGYDLVTCFEVAEHVEPEFADVLVRNLTDMSPRILASFAPPGQGGHYHVNCQTMGYWQEIFSQFDYVEVKEKADEVKALLRRYSDKPGVKAIYQNLAYFEQAT